MAQYSPSQTKPFREKRESVTVSPADTKKRQPKVPLYFSPDVEALLTPFRVRALQRIYEIAHEKLGERIKSTVVQVEDGYDEPGYTALVLAIWADMDKHEWRQADRAISDAVFDEESSWTDGERDDYVDVIRFEILPLKI